jgi:hypothetical protein
MTSLLFRASKKEIAASKTTMPERVKIFTLLLTNKVEALTTSKDYPDKMIV